MLRGRKKKIRDSSVTELTTLRSSPIVELSPAHKHINSVERQSGSQWSPTHTALSNVLILEEIFRNLMYEDLVSCCNVNSMWLAIAGSMICYYRITFDARSLVDELNVEVEEIIGFSSIAQNSRITFNNLMRKLRRNPKKHLMSIELRLCGVLTKYYLPLLIEFGARVHILDCEYKDRCFHVVSFFSNIYYFPNLQVLKLNGTRLKCLNFFPDTDLILPKLRRIYMGKTVPIEHWPDLLRIAPNIEELLEFPVQSMIRYSPFVKIRTFKSVLYLGPYDDFLSNKRNLSDLATSLDMLADLNVELTSLAVPNFHYLMPVRCSKLFGESKHLDRCWERWVKVDTAAITRSIQKILRSSKDSLKELTIPAASKAFGYVLPLDFQMGGVRVLKFEDDCSYLRAVKTENYFKSESVPRNIFASKWVEEHQYCPRNTDLAAIFPNLEKVEINFNLYKRTLFKFFPRDTFGPNMLGGHVKKLKIKGASPECFKELVKLFPNVTDLEMESTVGHLGLVFPIISTAWPELKTWTVIFDPTISFHPGKRRLNSSLDPVLTGIPEELCMRIKLWADPLEKEFEDKIRALQTETKSLLNMTNLERLEFILNGDDFYCHCNFKHKPAFISKVSVEYAFLSLPDLTVSVRMKKGMNSFGELENALEPVMDFIQIDNKYSPPRQNI